MVRLASQEGRVIYGPVSTSQHWDGKYKPPCLVIFIWILESKSQLEEKIDKEMMTSDDFFGGEFADRLTSRAHPLSVSRLE